MSKKKILLMVLLLVLLFASVIAGVFWHMRHYVLVDLQFYPKGAQYLDLRAQEISTRHYEKILRRLPGCEVRWNVPLSRSSWPEDSQTITVTALTEKDIRSLKYLTQLQTVEAEGCADYGNLLLAQRQYPNLQVNYSVPLGTERFSGHAKQVALENITPEEIQLLQYLPNLQRVLCSGGTPETVAGLMEYCGENRVEFLISLGSASFAMDTRVVNAEGVTEEQLNLLQFLPNMKKLHIREPEVSAERLLQLRQERPEVKISWEREVFGAVCTTEMTEIDLSEGRVTSLDRLDAEMAYFPDAKTVFLGESKLSNETLAAQRDRVRDKYKLVWTVSCGKKLKTRTDAATFMPVRERVYYFNDEEAHNLRYCEDMVCIDIGHMSISNVDFVEYMPNLEYLILAHTQVQYIEPIRTCKKLKFLELDWSPIRDLTPLQGCTALEDLNLGNTYADFTPVGKMTWLKNLWMIGCSTGARYRMTQALPDTKVMVVGSATVANGWRDLDNYYKMRDLLGMHYMSW